MTVIGHGTMAYWNPVPAAVFDDWVAALPLTPASRALDVGCGRAELLLRIVERYDCRAVGVDVLAPALAEARREAARRLRAGLLELRNQRFDPECFDRESFDLVACVGSSHAIAGQEQALRTLAAFVRPGGTLLIGEGHWRCEPARECLAFLESDAGELRTHEGYLALARDGGLQVLRTHRATEAEWSAYEDTYAFNIGSFVDANPRDPDAGAMRDRIQAWREAYLRWGRHTLGFGLYQLRRPKLPAPGHGTAAGSAA